ncbi:hypothetical protein B0T09DRAFT_331110 [Sordaria sp. MPI-SDFR-AT-0083]|nr:hypothetical protein B0T09DRAFT_331110 [Sordaria sp. MPI-SDFR-AT-0083]
MGGLRLLEVLPLLGGIWWYWWSISSVWGRWEVVSVIQNDIKPLSLCHCVWPRIKMVGCCVFLPSGSGKRWWWMGGGCNFAPHLNSKAKGLVISESLKLGKEANKLLIRRHFMLKADRQANDQITCKQTSKTKAEQWKQKCK